jgi:hypothetical protein
MKKCGTLKLALICWLLCAVNIASAQTYSPVFIFNSSDTKVKPAAYNEHSPGTSMGLGMVVYWPALDFLNYRGSVVLQNRKFNLTGSDDIERRYTASSIDIGAGFSSEFLDMLGIFIAVEGTTFVKLQCEGGDPCSKQGSQSFAGHLQAGMSLGPKWMKFEPYWEHSPSAPLKGAKSLTTYGLAIHFFPESFDPN